MFEQVSSSQIMLYITCDDILFANQHSFQGGWSCESQLLELTTGVKLHLRDLTERRHIYRFYKAFDRVPYNRLIYKMKQINVDKK